MRIFIMSNYVDQADEGFKTVALNLYQRLSSHHNVVLVNARRSIFTTKFWLNIKKFQPQVVHIILRPSIFTLMMARVMKLYCHHAKIVISALQPPLHYNFIRIFAPLFKLDLIITSCKETGTMFSNMGWSVAFLASGVDAKRFIPVAETAKQKFREKYNIDKEKFIVTHVGPIRRNRNLGVLNRIQSLPNVQVIIVANTAFTAHRKLYNSLKEHGCIIWRSYFEKIEEIYQLSDGYVFPARDQAGCVEMPLSIMEAMSCNLPIITTKFMALPDLFAEGDGLFYVDSDENFIPLLKMIEGKRLEIKTREMVLPYSWESITERLEEIYAKVIKEL